MSQQQRAIQQQQHQQQSSCSNRYAVVTYLLFAAAILLQLAAAVAGTRENGNKKEPSSLFYTRLRYDYYHLPIYKNLQKAAPHQETVVVANHNDGQITHYVNTNISLHDLSQNDLILEALDQVYKSRLLQSYEFSYDNQDDRRRSADLAKVDAHRCNRELDYLLGKREHIQTGGLDPELATFFDSYAGQEAGVLTGNTFWLGNWQQCNKRHIFDPREQISFTGRYCVASIRSEEWLTKIEQKVEHLKRIDYFKFDNQQFNYRQHFRIQLGLCLPESCDSTIIQERRQHVEQLAKSKLNRPYDSYNLTDLYCLPDESSPLREIPLSGRLLIGFSLIWLLLLVGSTWADAHNFKGASSSFFLQKIVVSFSLIGSYKHLSHVSRAAIAHDQAKQNGYTAKPNLAAPEQRQAEAATPTISDLHFFDSFKVLAMMVILVGHTGMITLQFCQYQLDFFTVSPLYFHFMASGAFYVDWFFCMTGFITAYAMFCSRAVYTNTLAHWIYSVFHRYWRLAPIYVLTFWFCRSLFQYTSSGPLWDYGTSNASLRAICQQESWLVPLTLTSNLHPLHRECIMPAWYIANDMQFYLITPFFLLLLAYRARLAWLSVIGVSLLSVALRIERYCNDPHARHLELMHPRYDMVMRNNWDLPSIYLQPQHRISTYLIGLLAGHYAFMVRSGQWSSSFFTPAQSNNNAVRNRNRARLAWLGLLTTLAMSMTSWILDASFVRSLEPHAKPIATLVYSVGHSVAGCGIAALFLALLFGQWPRVRQFMELPLWTRLARINFFVYLFQVEIIIWANNMQSRLPETSTYFTVQLLFFLGPALYALAWLVTLLVANPLAKLELEFVGVYMRVGKSTTTTAAAAAANNNNSNNNKNLLRVDREKEMEMEKQQLEQVLKHQANGRAVESSSSSCRQVNNHSTVRQQHNRNCAR